MLSANIEQFLAHRSVIFSLYSGYATETIESLVLFFIANLSIRFTITKINCKPTYIFQGLFFISKTKHLILKFYCRSSVFIPLYFKCGNVFLNFSSKRKKNLFLYHYRSIRWFSNRNSRIHSIIFNNAFQTWTLFSMNKIKEVP